MIVWVWCFQWIDWNVSNVQCLLLKNIFCQFQWISEVDSLNQSMINFLVVAKKNFWVKWFHWITWTGSQNHLYDAFMNWTDLFWVALKSTRQFIELRIVTFEHVPFTSNNVKQLFNHFLNRFIEINSLKDLFHYNYSNNSFLRRNCTDISWSIPSMPFYHLV